jgi:hypothetical protein
MVLEKLVERFVEEAPVCVMLRMAIEHVLAAERVDGVFERLDHAQAEGGLKFSMVADIMGLVAAKMQPSVHAGYQSEIERIGVTIKAVYDKLQRIKSRVSQGLLRETAANMAEIVDATKAALPPLLPGYRVKIIDGNHLRRTQRRLGVLRKRNVAPLPGHAVAVLDPCRKLIVDIFPCEDGHAQERTLLPAVQETIEANDLMIADRNFCTTDFLFGIAERRAAFVIRQHARSLRSELVGARERKGRTATGRVFEQKMRLFAKGSRTLEIRRITLKLDGKTRDGDKEIHVLTNLPGRVSAEKIAELYRNRWKIETAFAEVAKNLQGEIETLGYPKAALFAFTMALVVHNLLSVLQAAIRAAHGIEKVENEVSSYYLANEIAHAYRGMCIAVPPNYWRKRIGDLSPAQLARELIAVARQMRLARYRKHKRSSSKRTKPMNKKNRQHAATARLLSTA